MYHVYCMRMFTFHSKSKKFHRTVCNNFVACNVAGIIDSVVATRENCLYIIKVSVHFC